MCLWNARHRLLGPALLVLLLAAVSACDDDGLFVPEDFPAVYGFWSGQYRVNACVLSGAVDPFFCDEVFWNGASLILEMDLDQSGPEVGGPIYQGSLAGGVFGTVDLDGVLTLEGQIGGLEDDFTTTILAWQTGLVGDTLLGSWRFWVEDNTGQGFGAATVDASLVLYGPSVVKFFGCAAEGELDPDGEIIGSLDGLDCQLATGMFIEGLEDGALFDVYTLTGAAGDSIEITLRSGDFDALLLVADLEEEYLGGDDDSGGPPPDGTDAALTIVFDVADTVLVIATSFWPGEAGAYALGAELLEPPPLAAATSSTHRESGNGLRVIGGGVRKPGRLLDGSSEPRIRKFTRRSNPAEGPAE
ncbi:MAG: hypothetical protein JSV86_12635 [Gemmatimonadota bacterium]|nr:MAG: hypothetical protein JSV86_12635 [Gemmatimonadota bacterium]